jgi:uncharacterized protein YndB with AHSA1/START domain/uncharacterized protein YciI
MTRLITLVFTLIALACPARAGAPDPIQVERIINAPISEVWKAWTTEEGITAFLDRPCDIELRPGGSYEIYFAPEAPAGSRGSEGCTVLSWVSERMLSISWNAPPKYPGVRSGDRHTFVVIHLDPMDGLTTRVRLSHDGWPTDAEAGPLAEEWKGTREYFVKAWPSVLEALAAKFSSLENEIDPKAGWVYLIVGFSRPDLIQTMTEDEKATLGEHARYIEQLTGRGVVVVAGPCTDMKGPGIVVFQAVNEPAARHIMENDPAVKAGIFKAELHPMRLSFVRGRD